MQTKDDRYIRPYQEDDEEQVIGVWHRSGLAAYHYLPAFQRLSFEDAGNVFRTVIRPNKTIWVGVHTSHVVAFMAMLGSYIDRLYIDPVEWHKGWGHRFIKLAKEISPEHLELHTHQQNSTARALYEKDGFIPVKFGVSPAPEFVPDVEYHWRPDQSN